MSEAAARYLEIDPDEVQIGVRPMRDGFSAVSRARCSFTTTFPGEQATHGQYKTA